MDMLEDPARPSSSALLLIDVFSHFRFVDGDRLAQAQQQAAPAMAAAAAACRSRGIAVIYCNDNFQQWQGTWKDVLAYTVREGPTASARLAELLAPQEGDVVLLKSRHSAFFHTQLTPLLAFLKVRDLAIAGAATDACVLGTAIDAHIRGFRVAMLDDAVAATTPERNERALLHASDSVGLNVCGHAQWLATTTAGNAGAGG
ncbi:cysteine hydrolase family protein [Aerosticca soli]|jgi:nicotinamidase-related amidase|uniref:Nicotinamidase n=1 Tax=Aerosticca soli TaxID=2010829 RepID=A0A2Z6E4J8_9GAMM|nr:isochorismatase family cysteine hydrolase [Aerosticca soli]MDI3262097.1 isochorismatase family cysteine hydrolase [Fulvimonas sp.]BBD79439.1 nicotinamidase [Aerosticca soli]